jgi:hypothetical protein
MSTQETPSTSARLNIDNGWAARVRLLQKKSLNWSDLRWQAALMALSRGSFRAAIDTLNGAERPVCLMSGANGDLFILASDGIKLSGETWRDPALTEQRPWTITPEAEADAELLRQKITPEAEDFFQAQVLANTQYLETGAEYTIEAGQLWVYGAESPDILSRIDLIPTDFPSRDCFLGWLSRSIRPRLDLALLLHSIESSPVIKKFLSTDEDWECFVAMFSELTVVNVNPEVCVTLERPSVRHWLADRCSMQRGDNSLYAKTYFTYTRVKDGAYGVDKLSKFVLAWLNDDVGRLSENNAPGGRQDRFALYLALWRVHTPSEMVERHMYLDLKSRSGTDIDAQYWAPLSHLIASHRPTAPAVWRGITSRCFGGRDITALPTAWAQSWALEYADPGTVTQLAKSIQPALAAWPAAIAKQVYARFLNLSSELKGPALLPGLPEYKAAPIEVCMHYWPEDRACWDVAQALGDSLEEWQSALSTIQVSITECQLPDDLGASP